MLSGKDFQQVRNRDEKIFISFQETKVSEAKLPDEMKNMEDYPHTFWLAAEKDGYSGVGKQI